MKQTILVVNGCVRKKESRTLELGRLFLKELTDGFETQNQSVQVTFLELDQLDLQFLNQERLAERNRLLDQKNLTHPMFDLAQQFVAADLILWLAPIWDWSLPAMVKVYVENISVEGITFGVNESGLYGKVRANHLVYLTTLGGTLSESSTLIGQAYMEELSKMYGISHCHSLVISATDLEGFDLKEALKGCEKERASVVETIVRQNERESAPLEFQETIVESGREGRFQS